MMRTSAMNELIAELGQLLHLSGKKETLCYAGNARAIPKRAENAAA
jgi:hypothetical protein